MLGSTGVSSLATKILASALWATFIVVTVRKLWRRGDTPHERFVYSATRFWGICMTLAAPPLFAYLLPSGPLSYVPEVIFLAIVTFPVALWGGYAFGRMMALVAGVPRDS
jgi:hypothetical protein